MYITIIFSKKTYVENFVEKVTRRPFEAGKISQNFTSGKNLKFTVHLLNYYYTLWR